MRAFADLFAALDGTTSSQRKADALVAYLRAADPADAAWAVFFLAGAKPRQLMPTALLKQAAREMAGLPEWLFAASYDAVGDLAETIALVLPETVVQTSPVPSLARCMADHLLPLRGRPPAEAVARVQALWARLPPDTRLVATKLITGHLRVGVSRQGLVRALAQVGGLPRERLAQRLIPWLGLARHPTAQDYLALVAPEPASAGGAEAPGLTGGAPYPFFLAHPVAALLQADAEPAADPLPAPGARPDPAAAGAHDDPDLARLAARLGPAERWWTEWKWDGIRAQWVQREGQAWLWTRGDEWVSPQYPELAPLAQALPDGTVLDGELLAWHGGQPLPFGQLQRRLGRQRLSAALLREVPVCFMAYDLLEWAGQDLRAQALVARRAQLEAVFAQVAQAAPGLPVQVSPGWVGRSWAELAQQRAQARARGVEGLMLKALDGGYGVGRTRQAGPWLKWKLDPFTVDAVLVYAQAGHGRRANLFTDYTFAVWDAPPDAAERRLVPVAKAYSGLTDAEIAEVDRFVRRHTTERFGPVRAVVPELVFELGFEGVLRSSRHKSGLALRFPRMLRWRRDKTAAEADGLAGLMACLSPE